MNEKSQVLSSAIYILRNLDALSHLSKTQWITLVGFSIATALGGATGGVTVADAAGASHHATLAAIGFGVGGFIVGFANHLAGLVQPTPIPEIHDRAVRASDASVIQKRANAKDAHENAAKKDEISTGADVFSS